jgi:predicted PurR-regulated permease PerM
MDEPNPSPRSWDLTRIVLGVMTIGGLSIASFWVLKPFLLAGIWATMIVVATWPMLRALERRLWGKRSLAVAVMTLAFVLIVAAPLATAVVAIAERTDDIIAWVRSLATVSMPQPPEWVQRIPVVGPRAAERWRTIASASSDDLLRQAGPYIKDVAPWVIGQAGTLGTLLVQLLLAMIIAAILYANGEMAAAGVLAFARRLGGQAGERVTVLSAQAIRAVALGIVVTALIQAVVGGIGLVIAGVPYSLLLTSVMFMFGIAQIGAVPVLLGAVVWVYWSSGTFWAIVLLVWTVITGSFDNVLRPILIRRGADVPFLLIFAGVLGGLLAFGLIGLFVGPVVLSVTYTLLEAWVTRGDAHPGGQAPAAADTGIGSGAANG